MTKFRKELEHAKLEQPPDSENTHIRMFEGGVEYLPETMRAALKSDLENCKKEIDKLIKDNENALEKTFSSGDITSMRRNLVKYRDSP
ncbi:unnamed protein product, partial [Rotaria sp. Silwood1]